MKSAARGGPSWSLGYWDVGSGGPKQRKIKVCKKVSGQGDTLTPPLLQRDISYPMLIETQTGGGHIACSPQSDSQRKGCDVDVDFLGLEDEAYNWATTG